MAGLCVYKTILNGIVISGIDINILWMFLRGEVKEVSVDEETHSPFCKAPPVEQAINFVDDLLATDGPQPNTPGGRQCIVNETTIVARIL